MEDADIVPSPPSGELFAPELFQPDNINMDAIETHTPSIFDQQGMIPLPMDPSSSPEFMRKDSITTDLLNDTIMEDESILNSVDIGQKKERSVKHRESSSAKDTKHSSKNEGQHTDRRYLCYFCHKLFTRRRSVRDHISKIHGEKTWEPQRSLEVVVEPHTGEPIEPVEDIIARGPPPPPPKPTKSSKPSLTSENSREDKDVSEEAVQQSEEPEAGEETVAPTIEFRPEQLVPPPLTRKTSTPKAEVKVEPKAKSTPIPATMPSKLKKEDSERSTSRPVSVEPTAAPAPVIGKKRPLAQTKKGTAKVKSSTPSSKRLRLTDSERSTPARSPSATPASQKPAPGSKLKKPVPAPSPSPLPSSRHASPTPTPSVGTAASSNDDGEIFCICRKGDNHTWMIACDGPCEEWFHGKCVGIKERDGELIDKYICPHCEQEGFITTWKRMCRRPVCRKPARVKDDPPSKYCSVECGRMFFVDLIQRGDSNAQASKDGQYIVPQKKEKKMRKKVKRARPNGTATPLVSSSRPHTPAYSEDERTEYETDTSLDDEDLPNRGGPLRAAEVKAILLQCSTVDAWRELGKKPETPPRDLDDGEHSKLVFDDFEKDRIAVISKDLAELDQKLDDLALREKLLDLIKLRSAGIADDIKKTNSKLKNVCGYDRRVAWSQDEFLVWYNSQGGKQVIESGKIGPPDGDTHMTNGYEAEDDEKLSTMKGGVCIRNNCPKHGRTWQKSQLAELRFEQDLIKKRQDNLAQQEHDIRSRAQIRALEERGPVLLEDTA